MKILLFGEYSGLFNNLKEGFVELGHEVFLASDGNGFKKFPTDFNWKTRIQTKRIKQIFSVLKILLHNKKFKGYDIVLLIGPSIFSRYKFIEKPIFDLLIKNNNKVFQSGSGLQSIIFDYWFDNVNQKYHNYMAGYFIDERPDRRLYHNKKETEWEIKLIERINGIIPIWYEYAQPFRGNPKLLKTIKIPINVSKYEYKPNVVRNKIVFFHGLPSRPSSKGSQFIKEAFRRMELKHSDVAEFIIAGGMPFNEYMQIIDKTNVVLDDANSYSVAMNGLIAMASGKIVMGGAEQIANLELGYEENPIYNLTINVDQICQCIENVIERKNEIEEMGLESRRFVEKYHNYINVAKEYIEIFEQN